MLKYLMDTCAKQLRYAERGKPRESHCRLPHRTAPHNKHVGCGAETETETETQTETETEIENPPSDQRERAAARARVRFCCRLWRGPRLI